MPFVDVNITITDAPTKKPVQTPSTLSPTSDQSNPTTCPAGHPACTVASDCTAHSFAHCVDGCCANIGSKSAKGTKSAKAKSAKKA